MQTINVINNIVLKEGILHTYGRDGNVARVFLRQGNLEGRCAVYSLMMLLMLHGILNREDLLRKVSAKAPEYIKKLKRQFNHCTTRGYSLRELRLKLLRAFNNRLPVDVCVIRNRDKDSHRKLHNMIKEQLDKDEPVQIGLWSPQRKVGHSVVAIGYSQFDPTSIRLYCLDSACPLPYASIWNNVIDVNIDYDDVDKLDFNHQANEKVLVDSILLIDNERWIFQDLPFEPVEYDSIPFDPEGNDSILPFEPEEKDSILPF